MVQKWKNGSLCSIISGIILVFGAIINVILLEAQRLASPAWIHHAGFYILSFAIPVGLVLIVMGVVCHKDRKSEFLFEPKTEYNLSNNFV
jgi:hypothetical protein